MTFAELLKSHREAAGLSQKELAEKSELAQPTVANYELGKREPTWAAVQKLAAALGVPVTAFEESEGSSAGSGSLSHPPEEKKATKRKTTMTRTGDTQGGTPAKKPKK